MERARIIREYYQLRNFLNRGNKIANQASEVRFEIVQINPSEYRLYATAVGPHESPRIAIAVRGDHKTWGRTGFTQFRFLETYCAEFLHKLEERGGFEKRLRFLPINFMEDSAVELENILEQLLLEI